MLSHEQWRRGRTLPINLWAYYRLRLQFSLKASHAVSAGLHFSYRNTGNTFESLAETVSVVSTVPTDTHGTLSERLKKFDYSVNWTQRCLLNSLQSGDLLTSRGGTLPS